MFPISLVSTLQVLWFGAREKSTCSFGSRFKVGIPSGLENPRTEVTSWCRVGSTNYSQRTKSGPTVRFCELNFIGHPSGYVWSMAAFDLQQQSWVIIAELSSWDKAHKPSMFTIKTSTRKKKAGPCSRAVTNAKSGVEAHRVNTTYVWIASPSHLEASPGFSHSKLLTKSLRTISNPLWKQASICK